MKGARFLSRLIENINTPLSLKPAITPELVSNFIFDNSKRDDTRTNFENRDLEKNDLSNSLAFQSTQAEVDKKMEDKSLINPKTLVQTKDIDKNKNKDRVHYPIKPNLDYSLSESDEKLRNTMKNPSLIDKVIAQHSLSPTTTTTTLGISKNKSDYDYMNIVNQDYGSEKKIEKIPKSLKQPYSISFRKTLIHDQPNPKITIHINKISINMSGGLKDNRSLDKSVTPKKLSLNDYMKRRLNH